MIIYPKSKTLKDGCAYKHAAIKSEIKNFNSNYDYLILFKSFYFNIISKKVSLTDFLSCCDVESLSNQNRY